MGDKKEKKASQCDIEEHGKLINKRKKAKTKQHNNEKDELNAELDGSSTVGLSIPHFHDKEAHSFKAKNKEKHKKRISNDVEDIVPESSVSEISKKKERGKRFIEDYAEDLPVHSEKRRKKEKESCNNESAQAKPQHKDFDMHETNSKSERKSAKKKKKSNMSMDNEKEMENLLAFHKDNNSEHSKVLSDVEIGDSPENSNTGQNMRKEIKSKSGNQDSVVAKAETEGTANVTKIEDTLAYLHLWKSNRSSWKFNKNKQGQLLRIMYDHKLMSDGNFDDMLQYLQGLKGLAREREKQKAEGILKENENDQQNENHTEVQENRARQVYQLLTDAT